MSRHLLGVLLAAALLSILHASGCRKAYPIRMSARRPPLDKSTDSPLLSARRYKRLIIVAGSSTAEAMTPLVERAFQQKEVSVLSGGAILAPGKSPTEVAKEQAANDAFFKKVWDDLSEFRANYDLWEANAFLPRARRK